MTNKVPGLAGQVLISNTGGRQTLTVLKLQIDKPKGTHKKYREREERMSEGREERSDLDVMSS